LCEQFGTLSRMYLRSLIRDGKVEVNGRHENAGYRVRACDFVEVDADTSRGTSMVGEDIPLDVVFEDSEIIIVNKPAGMLVHPSHRIRFYESIVVSHREHFRQHLQLAIHRCRRTIPFV